MNIDQNINKLLIALKQRGKSYKINSFHFYNEKKNKYSTKYQILKKIKKEIYNTEKDKFEEIEVYENKKECYGKIEVMKYLIEEYQKEVR